MISIDSPAPEFETTTTDGQRVRLRDFRGKPLVLYFFPKAFTPGCMIQADQFQDAYPEIRAAGAELLGVSTDDHQTQCDFAQSRSLSFLMGSDSNGSIARSYDVIWPLLKLVRRVTFVIDALGTIRGIFHYELRLDLHVRSVLQVLKSIPAKTGQIA